MNEEIADKLEIIADCIRKHTEIPSKFKSQAIIYDLYEVMRDISEWSEQ